MLSRKTIDTLRNIGIIAHIDAGKTTCAERILYYAGRIHRTGEVHDGDTELDFDPKERQMGITISSAATSFEWTPRTGAARGVTHRVSLIDTPGHVDFTVEVERSLRVLDGAVAVFDGGHGVEPQSETVWRQADRYGVPRIAFVNKMDKVGASFQESVRSIRERLCGQGTMAAVPVQLPLGEEGSHRGVIDLLRRKVYTFDDAPGAAGAGGGAGGGAGRPGAVFHEQDVSAEMAADVERARAELVEACADVDEAVMARFVEQGAAAVPAEDLERALRAGTLALRMVPVLCGSAFKNKGVQMLLDAVCAYLPSPADVPAAKGREPATGHEVERAAKDDAPLCALAFKVVSLERAGALTLVRVYSGRLRPGDAVLDATTGKTERIGRLVSVHANKVTDVPSAGAGAIVAVVGFRGVRTGDTLSDPRSPVVLAGLTIPEPVVETAVEPRGAADEERLSAALARLSLEDPSFEVKTQEDTGQTILRTMGELHLTILVDRLARDHRVHVATGRPQVSYRETLIGRAEGDFTLSKQTGGPGQFARVVLSVGPAPRGTGLEFTDRTRAGAIPKAFVAWVEQGIRGAMSRGVVHGYPMVDVAVELCDGATHPVDSKGPAFEVAASMAFKQAAAKAGVSLLEPVMEVEVSAPVESLGEVLGDLQARRGEVQSVTDRGNERLVKALVPLKALFGHVSDLRSRTQGRATATMRPSHYAPIV